MAREGDTAAAEKIFNEIVKREARRQPRLGRDGRI